MAIEKTIKMKQNLLFFIFKKFPIGLNENLREEDNLSTRDNWPVPNVSFVRRFYCKQMASEEINVFTGWAIIILEYRMNKIE